MLRPNDLRFPDNIQYVMVRRGFPNKNLIYDCYRNKDAVQHLANCKSSGDFSAPFRCTALRCEMTGAIGQSPSLIKIIIPSRGIDPETYVYIVCGERACSGAGGGVVVFIDAGIVGILAVGATRVDEQVAAKLVGYVQI